MTKPITRVIGGAFDFLAVLIGVAGLAIALVVITGSRRPSNSSDQGALVADWRSLAQQGQRMGSPTAPVTIIEFSDFQCPYCAEAARVLRSLRAKHADRVALIYRHYPLQRMHPHAWMAAIASECAADQNRFEAFHDRLFEDQTSIGERSWTSFAIVAGVPDTLRFQGCVDQRRHKSRLEEDIAAAESIGVRGTPTLLVNGVLFRGTPTLDELEHHISRLP